ncbi:hypothetical protein BaRGS_00001909 [Batillaria attramentaria]|uniref:Uncharacterized protein n=1 Tax=Batillaria attramentaria TaxID=370345 RepID=A0ABD0M6E1_9CAEN
MFTDEGVIGVEKTKIANPNCDTYSHYTINGNTVIPDIGLVRPILEYGQSVWHPYQKGLCCEIEDVMRRATKMIVSKSNMEHSFVVVTFLLIAAHCVTADGNTTAPAAASSSTLAPAQTTSEAGNPQTTTVADTMSTVTAPPSNDSSTTNVTAAPSNDSSTTEVAADNSTSATAPSGATAPPTATTASTANTTTTTPPSTTTVPSGNTPSTTFTHDQTTTRSPPTTTTADTTKTNSTSPTASPTKSSTPSPTTSTGKPPQISVPDVIISETTLLLANNADLFVELKVKSASNVAVALEGVTLAVFYGNETVAVDFTFTAENKTDTSGFFVQPLDKETLQDMQSAVVTLYNSSDFSNATVKNEGLRDFLIVSSVSSSVEPIKTSVLETLGHTEKPVPVVNRTKLAEINITGPLSLSRCPENASSFVLSPVTMGNDNNCSLETYTTKVEVVVESEDARICEETKVKEVENAVENELVEEINKRCACGMTRELLVGKVWTCKPKIYLKAGLQGIFPAQRAAFYKAYKEWIMSGPTVEVSPGSKIHLVNCTTNCVLAKPAAHSDDKNKNVTVTVAVVLSCIAVFLVIFVAVVIYMRRKRRGILQFRMTRLTEDDDMDDMEDFIGGGGMDENEPSFSNSQYNLTK